MSSSASPNQGQLDVFAHTTDEPASRPDGLEEEKRSAQLTELPGTTFEEIFQSNLKAYRCTNCGEVVSAFDFTEEESLRIAGGNPKHECLERC